MPLVGPHFALRTYCNFLSFHFFFTPITALGKWLERLSVAACFALVGYLIVRAKFDQFILSEETLILHTIVGFALIIVPYLAFASVSCVRVDRFYED